MDICSFYCLPFMPYLPEKVPPFSCGETDSLSLAKCPDGTLEHKECDPNFSGYMIMFVLEKGTWPKWANQSEFFGPWVEISKRDALYFLPDLNLRIRHHIRGQEEKEREPGYADKVWALGSSQLWIFNLCDPVSIFIYQSSISMVSIMQPKVI